MVGVGTEGLGKGLLLGTGDGTGGLAKGLNNGLYGLQKGVQ